MEVFAKVMEMQFYKEKLCNIYNLHKNFQS